MAWFAAIVKGRPCKLALVRIGMAIGAANKGNLVASRGARRNVTLGAGDRGVASCERIGSCRMFFDPKERRLPSVDRVASGTFAFIGTRAELTAVRVRCMAVGALGEGNRFFEIRSGVALQAIDFRVFAEQREFYLGVIEMLVAGDFSPAAGDVASRAGLRESSVMRIAMAIRTFSELQSPEPRRLVRSGGVALRARYWRVKPCQWKSRLGMIELRGCFPIRNIVALRAIWSQPAFVNIFVAACAVLRQTEIRLPQILHLDRTPFGLTDAFRLVTLAAIQCSVFPLQRVAGSLVIKTLQRRDPADEFEILAIVFGVALPAVFFVWEAGVQSASLRNPL